MDLRFGTGERPLWRKKVSWFKCLDILLKVVTIVGLGAGLLELKSSQAQRARESDLQAWELLKAGEGKRANLGRKWALEYLLSRRQAFYGVNLDGAILPGLTVPGSNFSWSALNRALLSHSNLRGALAKSADLDSVVLESADMRDAAFENSWMRRANLHLADLRGSVLTNVHFQGARLVLAKLDGALVMSASFRGANLSQASLEGIREWKSIRDIEMANIHDVKASAEFIRWAKDHGAVDVEGEKAYRDLLAEKRRTGWDLWFEAAERE